MPENRTKEMFLNTMSMWPAGVTIITADDAGQFRGATVSSFTSLSTEPGQVILALKNDSRVLELAKTTGSFFVSVLADDQQDASNAMARYESDAIDTPHIPNAAATFACTLSEVLTPTVGTHVIMVGRVDTCTFREDAKPLLYWNRNYRRVHSR